MRYNGAATAGTSGRVDIATADELGNPITILGRVNVYIVGAKPDPTWFTVTSTKRSIAGDSLILDNEHLNVQPGARVFAMHYGGATQHWNHPIAVTYDSWTARWMIRNEDGEKMPVGISFHVRIDPSASLITTPHNYATNSLTIDDPVANYNPFATIVVTPWSAGNRRMTRAFAVRYAAPYWRIVFQDGSPMPVSDYTRIPYDNAGFFVKIVGASTYVDDRVGPQDPSGFNLTSKSNGVGLDIVGRAPRSSGDTRYLRNFCWAAGSTLTPVIATLNQTPLPYPAPASYYFFFEAAIYGASFVNGTATIYHEDGTNIDPFVPLNVMAPYRASCAPPNQ